MPAYLIFERETGQIMHVHIEPDEVATPREGLLAMVDPSHERESLEIAVTDLEQLRAGIAGRLDPQTGKTMPAEEDGIGFAGGWAGANSPHALPPHVRRSYQRAGGDQPAKS
jgi:hypothetical protein